LALEGDPDQPETPTPEHSAKGNVRQPGRRPLTPISTVSSHCDLNLPPAIFNQDLGADNFGGVRVFPWGDAEVRNAGHNDFVTLKSAILGSHRKVSAPEVEHWLTADPAEHDSRGVV
jgi:hypothetical protein